MTVMLKSITDQHRGDSKQTKQRKPVHDCLDKVDVADGVGNSSRLQYRLVGEVYY